MRPEMLKEVLVGKGREEGENGVGGKREGAYKSGSFCVSITAASGIPKFEAGPQKSVCA